MKVSWRMYRVNEYHFRVLLFFFFKKNPPLFKKLFKALFLLLMVYSFINKKKKRQTIFSSQPPEGETHKCSTDFAKWKQLMPRACPKCRRIRKTLSRINKNEIPAIYMSLFLRESVLTTLHRCLYALACLHPKCCQHSHFCHLKAVALPEFCDYVYIALRKNEKLFCNYISA